MNEKDMMNLKVLANAYVEKKNKEVLDALEKAMSGSSKNVVYTRALADKVVGKFIALAYAQGYADCFDKIEPKRSIFM